MKGTRKCLYGGAVLLLAGAGYGLSGRAHADCGYEVEALTLELVTLEPLDTRSEAQVDAEAALLAESARLTGSNTKSYGSQIYWHFGPSGEHSVIQLVPVEDP